MGLIKLPEPAKLIVGMLATSEAGFGAAVRRLSDRYGPVALRGEVMPFEFTRYYEKEMGPTILRQFVAFRELIAPDRLPVIKRETNELEPALAAELGEAAPRPVNLDPGYVTLSKVVLATTKDYSHRLYLGDGIYGEVTLHYTKGRWEPWPWTYPDYRTEAYARFFDSVRKILAASAEKE